MAKTIDQIATEVLGAQLFEIIRLQVQLNAALEEIAALRAEQAKAKQAACCDCPYSLP